jgi:predicted HD phosphohydrolase
MREKVMSTRIFVLSFSAATLIFLAIPISEANGEMSFTRMDQGKIEEWMAIGQAVTQRQASMPSVIKKMLRQLEEQVDGFAVNQLHHCLQTATRAHREGASEEMTVAALCHDIGKVISVENHPAIAAEILKPYVSHETYEIIRTHQDFQGRHYYALMGKDPDARRQYSAEAWYEMACLFTDGWDQTSFDPEYDTLPLSYFEPMVDRVFARTKSARALSA